MVILVREGKSLKVLPLQPIAAPFCMGISVSGLFLKSPLIVAQCSPLLRCNFCRGAYLIPQTSCLCSPMQPNASHSFIVILFSEGNYSKFLPLQPIAAHSYMEILVREGNSSKILPLQPIAAHSYLAILVGEVFLQKSSHCSPLQPTLSW